MLVLSRYFRNLGERGRENKDTLVTTCHNKRTRRRVAYDIHLRLYPTSMSLSSVQVAITPAAGSIPACKPNLMPFHINYNGPAAVSAFMHVEKLVDSFESAEAHGFELQVGALVENETFMFNSWMSYRQIILRQMLEVLRH